MLAMVRWEYFVILQAKFVRMAAGYLHIYSLDLFYIAIFFLTKNQKDFVSMKSF